MKDKFAEFLKNNYQNLTDKEILAITDKMVELLPQEVSKLSDIKVGEKFRFRGYEFTKLADETESCYCLLNDSVFESKFGEANDWAKSPIRKHLNKFDKQGNSEVLPHINENDLFSLSLNYYAYKVPNGRTEDKITLPSWEEYVAYDFAPTDKYAWLRSGTADGADYAYLLNSSGGYFSYCCTSSYAVRPALHLRKDLEVEIRI